VSALLSLTQHKVIQTEPVVVDSFGGFHTCRPTRFNGGWYAAWWGPSERHIVGPYNRASHAQAEARYAAACAHQDAVARNHSRSP
jgi:hypothetical protein